MSEDKKYKISTELTQEIIGFLENPFDGTREAIDLLKSNDILTEEEINRVIAILGKFPAFAVFQILGQLSSKVEEIGV